MTIEQDAPHLNKAIDYAMEVCAGVIVAGEYAKLACQRFLDDLERENAPWFFDSERAEHACEFIERLPHIKGEWAERRELLVLEPWQCFIVCNLYGWYRIIEPHQSRAEVKLLVRDAQIRIYGRATGGWNAIQAEYLSQVSTAIRPPEASIRFYGIWEDVKRPPAAPGALPPVMEAERGTRRFKTAMVDVARKNAKSTLAAAIGLYMIEADGEAGAEVYSAATTRNQAKIVFSIAQGMARRCPELPLEVRAHNINAVQNAAKFEALHAQGETLDGHNIHCAICDELHAWKSRAVYDVIETATGARLQPLIFNITTAGYDTGGICYDVRRYLIRILEGQIDDDSFFGIIYTLDKDDDWTDREVWPKANPNWNVSVYPFDMEALCRKASEVPSQVNAFLTKRMNVWVNAAEAWMDMIRWEACRDAEMRIADFAGEKCFGGIDLASKIDVNSQAQLFTREIDGEEHIYCFMRHWLPEAAVESDPNAQYDGWVRSDYMRTTPGNIIDVDRIEADTMEEMVAPHDLVALGVDPGHNSTQYGVHMAQEGVQTVDVRPTVLNFSEPMKWLEAYVKDGRFHHNCPVLTWMISNVEIKRDQKDNIYPRKGAVNRKIDGVIALLMALNLLKLSADKNTTIYDKRGVITV